MANPGFQTINSGFQGVGQFGFQEEPGGVVVQPPATFNLRPKRRVKKKKLEIIQEIREEVIVEVPRETKPYLQQILFEMERAGFDFLETEEEDDVLVLTFMLKKLQ